MSEYTENFSGYCGFCNKFTLFMWSSSLQTFVSAYGCCKRDRKRQKKKEK